MTPTLADLNGHCAFFSAPSPHKDDCALPDAEKAVDHNAHEVTEPLQDDFLEDDATQTNIAKESVDESWHTHRKQSIPPFPTNKLTPEELEAMQLPVSGRGAYHPLEHGQLDEQELNALNKEAGVRQQKPPEETLVDESIDDSDRTSRAWVDFNQHGDYFVDRDPRFVPDEDSPLSEPKTGEDEESYIER